MKKLFLLTVAVIAFASCRDYQGEIDALNRSKDSLMFLAFAKDSSIESFVASINEIEQNIDSITSRHNLLVASAAQETEMSVTKKEKIIASLEALNTLLAENRQKLSDLQARVKKSGIKINSLEKLIATLNRQIAAKDSEIVVLNTTISDLNTNIALMKQTIDTLTAENTARQDTIRDQTTRLHTAYYIVDNYKSLRDKKVLTKEGGFLGIGKKQSVLSDFNREPFTMIDISQTQNIAINNTKNARLLSEHPAGSYKLNKAQEKYTGITITDSELFWKASKYLVVVTN